MTPLARRTVLLAGLTAPLARAGEPGFEWRPWPRDKRVPALDLETLDGKRWRLGEQRGRVVLANFWASWCEPCRAEMPSLAHLARERRDDGLLVVAVNYRETLLAVQRFLERDQLDLPVLLDRDGAAAAAWTPRIFPSTVVFTRHGRPAGVLVGEIDWQGPAATALLAPWLAEPAPRAARL
jgi:thiol-disulfide isomerase/thioredoxin